MAKIRANTQILDQSLNWEKLEANFLDGVDLNLTNGNNDATITGVADPQNDRDVATKGYVDTLAQGLKSQDTARVRAQGDVGTLSGLQTIDGVALQDGDQILLDQQTTSIEDGLYIVRSGSWERHPDWQTGEAVGARYVFIIEGTDDNKGYVCTNDSGSDIVGTDDLVFVQFSGAGTINAGAGMVQSGTYFNVQATDNSITVNADDIQVNIGNTNGTSLEVSSTGVELAATITGGRTFNTGGSNFNVDAGAGDIALKADDITFDDDEVQHALTTSAIPFAMTATTDYGNGNGTSTGDIINQFRADFTDEAIINALCELKADISSSTVTAGNGLTDTNGVFSVGDSTTDSITWSFNDAQALTFNSVNYTGTNNESLNVIFSNGDSSTSPYINIELDKNSGADITSGLQLSTANAVLRYEDSNITINDTISNGFSGGILNGGVNNWSLDASPDGTVNLAIATVAYVDSKVGNVQANNGLTNNSGTIQLGGTLIQNTTITGDYSFKSEVTNSSSYAAYISTDKTNYNVELHSESTGNTDNNIDVNPSNISIKVDDTVGGAGNGVSEIKLESDSIKVSTSSNDGMEYSADYSTNNATNDRWITDKGYVDSAVAGVLAGNGLTNNSGTIELGGTLTKTTTITDGRASGSQAGIEYAADYSADYSDRSLVDKAFVDNAVDAENGLSKDATSKKIKMGGFLTENTLVQTGAYDFKLEHAPGMGELSHLVIKGSSNEIEWYSQTVSANTKFNTISNQGTFTSTDGTNTSTVKVVSDGTGEFSSTTSDVENKYAIAESGLTISADDTLGGSGTGVTTIGVTSSKVTVTTSSGNGMEYAADYSTNNATNDRWIPDKAYVDSQVSSGVTASNGLTKVGADIQLGGSLSKDTTINVNHYDYSILGNNDVTNYDEDLYLGVASGNELSNIEANVTQSVKFNLGTTFEVSGATNFGIGNAVNAYTIGHQPDGTVALAIATTKYVDDSLAAYGVRKYNQTTTLNITNQTATLDTAPSTGFANGAVYLNGVRQILTTDYTVTNTTTGEITFTSNQEIVSGDTVIFDYDDK